MKSMRWVLSLVVVMMVAFASWVWAQDLSDIALPGPRMEGGKPLMQALKDRQSTRAFSSEKLPIQVVADLLWAAAGINRAMKYAVSNLDEPSHLSSDSCSRSLTSPSPSLRVVPEMLAACFLNLPSRCAGNLSPSPSGAHGPLPGAVP